MLKNVLLISTLILFAQNQAFASGCDCGSVSAIVKMGTLEVNLNTAKEAQSIRSEILLAAQNIIGTLKVQTATLARALQDIKETLSAQMKGYAGSISYTRGDSVFHSGTHQVPVQASSSSVSGRTSGGSYMTGGGLIQGYTNMAGNNTDATGGTETAPQHTLVKYIIKAD